MKKIVVFIIFASIVIIGYILIKSISASSTIQSFDFDDLQFQYESVTNNGSTLYISDGYDMQISMDEEDISIMFDRNDSIYIVDRNTEQMRIFVDGTKVVTCDSVGSNCTGELQDIEEDIIVLINLLIR